MGDLKNAMHIAGSGMKAQSARMTVISQNVANASSTASTPEGEPYRRQTITFKNVLDKELGTEVVKIDKIGKDMSDFERSYDPGHPAADAEGYVLMPNVTTAIEMADMREAQRTYEANLNVIDTTKQMLQSTMELLR